jgi:pimeloyl-ACP methyl ester carboxylesterase
MSLTGPVFLDGIIVLTIVVFVAVVLVWPRLTKRTPWHVGGRVGALLAVNVLVLLTAATQMNASYLFFSNWSDLSGALSGHIAHSAQSRGGNPRRAPELPVRGAAAPVAARPPAVTQPVSSNGTVTYTVHGRRSGLTGKILVRLPAGYRTSSPRERYPVLEAFHGYPGDPLSLVDVYDVPGFVDHLVQEHRMRDPLIVMPQIEIPNGVDTEGVNGPAGDPQVETWLTRDVPAWVGQHFKVIPNRDAWATIGLSAGGWIAAMAAVLHPAQYGAAIVLGGYFRPDFGSRYRPFSPTSPQGQRYDLVRQVTRHAPPVSVWVETSRADKLSYSTSSAFLQAARPPLAVHADVLKDAGHRASVWISQEQAALRWLGTDIRGFRATGSTPPHRITGTHLARPVHRPHRPHGPHRPRPPQRPHRSSSPPKHRRCTTASACRCSRPGRPARTRRATGGSRGTAGGVATDRTS